MTDTQNDIAIFEPSADETFAESRNFQLSPEDARKSLQEKQRAKSQRLADFAPAASEEISAALAAADAARELLEDLMAANEGALNGVCQAILAVGHLRRKIHLVKSLALTADAEKHLAKTALDYFVNKSEQATPQNVTGFNAYADDLAWRKVLASHIDAYVAPLETQVEGLIAKIKAEASEFKMDLQLVFQKFADERARAGEPILLDAGLFEGLF
jgi:hypothetical protein